MRASSTSPPRAPPLNDEHEEIFIDASGLTCPMPVLKLRMALALVKPGSLIKVRATDPGARRDFENFCRSTGHDLVRVETKGKVLDFHVEKK